MVPLRYPLETEGTTTLQRALELADEQDDAHLYFLHVNLAHTNERVERSDFIEEVEAVAGPVESASYHVRKAFLLEEAILQEAVQQNADYVVIGTDTRSWWWRILAHRLGIDIDLEAFLQKHLGTKLIVV